MNDPGLREHNTDRMFMVVDTDGDGVITSDDLTAVGTRIGEQLHIAGTPAAAAIVDGYAAWWEQLRADCDGDGRISRAEFAQAILSGGGDPQTYFNQQMAKIISLVADVMDTDGDGFIEQDEYVALFRAVPEIDRQVVLAGFARLDANGDGRISREEFQAGVADLVLSTNPADPGSSLFG